MKAILPLLFVGAALGCAPTPLPDTAVMPLTGGGTPIMSDQGAIGLSAYVLSQPSRYVGHPIDTARAMAAVDYLAGALYSNPHWIGIPAQHKQLMLQGRSEVRQTLGVAPGAPSQAVVNGLIAASNAMANGIPQAAGAALPPSVFTLGPERTLALLQSPPRLPAANVATQSVNNDITFGCSFSPNCS